MDFVKGPGDNGIDYLINLQGAPSMREAEKNGTSLEKWHVVVMCKEVHSLCKLSGSTLGQFLMRGCAGC